MYFLIKNEDLLDKYNTIWDKVSAGIKKQKKKQQKMTASLSVIIFFQKPK